MVNSSLVCLWLSALFWIEGVDSSMVVANGRAAFKQLQQRQKGASFITSMNFEHKLRLCNAYPYQHPMEVYLGEEKLTEKPLGYKDCQEFSKALKVGDKLDFRVGDSSAGSFTVGKQLPKNSSGSLDYDVVLIIVIYRRDSHSTAVSFESHIFARLINSQISIIDTYRGTAKATPFIRDVSEAKTDRNEKLRYDSVVALNQGHYEVCLQGADGEAKALHELVALNSESYVVVRIGLEGEQGESYPQELMVFPRSDPRTLMGTAALSWDPHTLMGKTLMRTLLATAAAAAVAIMSGLPLASAWLR